MSDVNEAIQNWRAALAGKEALDTHAVDELQDHLESELTRIPAEGLAADERVLLASRRIGSPHDLGEAFFAADPVAIWRRRVLWMVTGLFVLSILPRAILGWTGPLSIWAMSAGASPVTVTTAAAAANLGVWGVILFLVWRRIKGVPTNATATRWLTRRPGVAFTVLIGAVVVMSTLRLFNDVQNHRFASIEVIGSVAQSQAQIHFTVGLLIPSILALIAWRCYVPAKTRSA